MWSQQTGQQDVVTTNRTAACGHNKTCTGKSVLSVLTCPRKISSLSTDAVNGLETRTNLSWNKSEKELVSKVIGE